MARPKEWERIARDQHMSLQSILKSTADLTEQMLMHVGGGFYANNGALLAHQILTLDRQIAQANNLSLELQSLIEDNDKSAAEMEKSVLRKYRIKEA